MKKFTLIFFTLMCFGIAKAHVVKKAHPFFTQKTFTVTGINSLKNYETTFKFFPERKIIYGPAPKAISFQNKLVIEISRIAIMPSAIRKNNKGFAQLKLVA